MLRSAGPVLASRCVPVVERGPIERMVRDEGRARDGN